MKTLEQIDYLRKQLGIRDSQVLNDLLNSYDNAQISLQNQLVKQQQIVDKAVEWINSHIETYTKNGISIIDWNTTSDPRQLKKILRGENNE